MEGVSTDTLRVLAPKWSLAGDDQLLNLLQTTHQRIISKCQDVSSKLEEMASSLDDASINLQNVNNKFMALNNSQFIESRVYDDDADLGGETQPNKDTPQPAPVDEISMLKDSLAILERAHETAEILDGSDSDSDAEISVVLRPKDAYAHRPLPHIIGSQQWKNKWHAGLLVEDSDTDSCASKRDGDIEQYSESEEEMEEQAFEENTLSESSSSLPGSAGAAAAPARPADVAAALAKRLGAETHTVVREETEDDRPAPAPVRKVYKPEQPATSAIFSDEPPPLVADSSSDEDIFAELEKHTPHTQRSKPQAPGDPAGDLFRFDSPPAPLDQGDIFSDFAPKQVEKPAKQKTTLFEDESEPELFAEPAPKKATQDNTESETSSKKPVGGISLFGSNKGTESIGAAILKRNQRKSSSSGESGSDDDNKRTDNFDKQTRKPETIIKNNDDTESIGQNKNIDEIDKGITKTEKDIFDDLFSKSESAQKKTSQAPKETKTTAVTKATFVTNKAITVKEKAKTSVKDLFNDNLFDDIDDIFTSNVKLPTNKSNQKSIFDDDGLFSDVEVNSTNKSKNNNESPSNATTSKANNSIFSSDDELFSDVKESNTIIAKKSQSQAKDDNANITVSEKDATKTNIIKKPTELNQEKPLSNDSPQTAKTLPKPQIKTKTIFDSDSDDDIFAKLKTPVNKKTNAIENDFTSDKNTPETKDKTNDENKLPSKNKLKVDEKQLIQSPSLFDEDEIDDLFITANKLKESNDQKYSTKVESTTSIDEPVIDKSFSSSKDDSTNSVKNKDISTHIIVDETQDITYKIESNVPENETSKKTDSFDDNHLFSDPKKVDIVQAHEIVTDESKVVESIQDVNTSKEELKPDSKPIAKSTSVGNIENEANAVTISNKSKHEVKQAVFDDPFEPDEIEAITSKTKTVTSGADLFDDIFTEPPAFEKPAEPKKSKNVNALFDDDSDDESLFFKKDDVISDEKPEIFMKNANFDIFVDEPPAIDVDFTTKTDKSTEPDDDLFSPVQQSGNVMQSIKLADDENDIFASIPDQENVSKLVENLNEDELFASATKAVPNSIEIDKSKDFNAVPNYEENVPHSVKVVDPSIVDDKPLSNEIFADKPRTNIFDEIDNEDLFSSKIVKNTENVIVDNTDSDDELFGNLPDLPKPSRNDIPKLDQNNSNLFTNKDKKDEFDDIFKSESPKKDTEIKKIGKLNTINFNINVNALMPGASPKKILKERKDEQSEVEQKNYRRLDETDSEPVSISFQDENKITDEEELKSEKSVAFDEKSEVLDNNLSKQRPRIQVKRRPSSRKARHEAVRKSAIDFGDDTDNSSSFDEPKPIRTKEDSKREDYLGKEDLNESNKNNLIQDTKDQNIQEITTDSLTKTQELVAKESDKKYLAKEDDIFNSMLTNVPHKSSAVPSISKEIENQTQNVTDKQTTTKIVYILNDEDIFNTDPKNTETFDNNLKPNTEKNDIFKNTDGIKTLGKTYKEDTNKEQINTKLAKEESKSAKDTKSLKDNKSNLFDDSDEELFTKNKKILKKTTIFDSDSEEDLFTGKKSTEKKNKEVKNREVKERKEVVVKGSLFGDDDDDDDDLFGIKKQKSEPKPNLPAPTSSKEGSTSLATTSKSAEPVFEDPLSLLGSDD